ncbi:MAG: carboxypeptidase regulatory-like domain-containing protein, partial [Mediterranea sp.]|nr:carboxypeptidase regulatory-like domain-containing protein [Mediterranea sp.]
MRHVRQTMENGLRVVAFSLLTAGLTTACHDKDDPKPEVVSTPDATTEYYILGTVQNAGKAQANIQVNAAGKELTTDAKGEFQVTLTQTGTFAIRVEQAKYLPIKTEVVIPQGAENRTAVKIVLPLTEKSEPTLVDPSQIEEGKPAKVEDTSNSNRDVPDQEQDMGITAPDQVNESTPIAKMSIEIPKGALEESQEISVTTYVPIPTVTNTVPKNEEGKEVEKSTPLAAAHFLPDGLQFKTGVQISIPNPLPGVELAEEEMELKYLDPKTNQWVDPEKKENVTTSQATYTTKVHHFSAYAINVKTKVNASAETVDNSVSLGSKKVDNSNELKATRDVTLTYKEKT